MGNKESCFIAYIGLVLFSLAFHGCSEPETDYSPDIYSDFYHIYITVTSVPDCTVVLTGSIYYPKNPDKANHKLLNHGFCWSSTSEFPSQNDNIIISGKNSYFTDTLSGLTPNTYYRVRAFGEFDFGIIYSAVKKFVVYPN